jgi:hypothetical protein
MSEMHWNRFPTMILQDQQGSFNFHLCYCYEHGLSLVFERELQLASYEDLSVLVYEEQQGIDPGNRCKSTNLDQAETPQGRHFSRAA